VLFVIALLLAIFVLPSPWGVIAVAVALVLDVTEVTVGLWYSRRRKAKVGAESMVGASGVALGELRPDGQVRVNGEIWRASCVVGCEQGAAVVVRSIDGLTLEVEPA
jgi:membrane protein implicated in regulation of membrane protease activity